jgi:hypothetical protein
MDPPHDQLTSTPARRTPIRSRRSDVLRSDSFFDMSARCSTRHDPQDRLQATHSPARHALEFVRGRGPGAVRHQPGAVHRS